MEIIIAKDAEQAAAVVADRFEAVLRERGEDGAVLGLATGSSPVLTYRELIARHREQGLSFAHARAFLLDEYIGLSADHEQSYHRFIRDTFTGHVDIPDELVLSPDGEASDPRAEAVRYDASIGEAGGVDIQILGIGANGHIGFNEPSSSFGSRTRVKTLTEQTVRDNARFFSSSDEVPIHVLTQGLETIREARRIVLIATGAGKAQAVRDMAEGPVSAACPASILQMHPAVTVVVDEAAARDLTHADYYRFIQSQKDRLAS
ncbi:glucosamine-6-phosphate deaminase [Brachybacterium halotolerans subsp. kimchii]|uniref:glucosamine-6-phosphate deaminase n=1 Tax=Brachybacterium halotolerans TaxID=2795215 RepID=UPI001E3573CE|nr:glucosamine-6-phosphate deaminase [Brachybacterium halotolerans]UEJ83420.1 glucosamine-6-phosphate deaminase [Brachybacterium halotolerans subsp. kimchii]